MDGETFVVDPDFTVIFGCRSVLSLIGLATGVVGYYLMERQWDNEAPVALTLPQVVAEVEAGDNAGNAADASSSYVNMNDPSRVVGPARDLVKVRTDDSEDRRYHPRQAAGNTTEPVASATAAQYYGTPEASGAQLATAFPLPKMMLIGLSLWSLSFVLDPAIGGFRLYANFFNIASFLLSALIGPLLAFPMRNAILRRDIDSKKKLFLALIIIFLLVSTFSIIDPEVDAPWYFNFVAGE